MIVDNTVIEGSQGVYAEKNATVPVIRHGGIFLALLSDQAGAIKLSG